MCTLAVVFGVSSALSAFGAYQQGQAAAANSRAQAQIAENNAQITRNQMQSVAEKEAIDKQRLRDSIAKQRAQGRTGFAAGGVVLGVGSALDWELDLSETEANDLSLISYNAELERNALLNQSNNFAAQAQINRMAAKDANAASILGAGTSLLSSYVTYKTTFN